LAGADLPIPCRITPEKRIEVDGYFVCQGLGVKGPIVFLVDTGSTTSSLGHKDAMAMNLKGQSLNPSRETVVGIGGFAASYEVPEVDIIIMGGGDQETCHLPFVLYHRPVKRKKSKTKGPFKYEGETVAASPSILGFDALTSMRLILETDFENYAVLRKRN
jgi:hypothetical protein